MPRKKHLYQSEKVGQARLAGLRMARQPVAAKPAWVPELEKWEQAKYDGLKGWPPEWVPEPQREQFRLNRTCLFFLVEEKKATYAEIRSRFDSLAQNKRGAIILAHIKDAKPYDDGLRHLVTLYQASSLNPEEGLRRLAGETAVAGFRAQTGYQKRADYSEKKDVQEIGRKLWLENPSLTIAAIERFPEMRVYKRRYKGRHTLRDWLNEIDTRLKKTGRPRHS